MPKARIINAEVLEGLASIPNESLQLCITSPPYWGLRDYGTASWEGGAPTCDHRREDKAGTSSSGLEGGKGNVHHGHGAHYTSTCTKCGARRVDDQLGLEKTPEEYVEHLVAVFREVRRVLRPDGICFLNLGDSYAGGGRAGKNGVQKWGGIESGNQDRKYGPPSGIPAGLKPKDLVGIPWRVAFALQADGWWLRSDVVEEVELYCPCGCGYVLEERIWRYAQDREVVWSKPNPMPESTTDRPTKSHEYIFILTKSSRYFWDQEAAREVTSNPDRPALAGHGKARPEHTGNQVYQHADKDREWGVGGTRNIRSVWNIATAPFPGEFCTACKRFYVDGGRHLAKHRDKETDEESKICACGRWDSWISHFACFPQTLVEPMVKAGTSEVGCCPECGAPRERVVERKAAERDDSGRTHSLAKQRMGKTPPPEKGWESTRKTVGFRSTCECGSNLRKDDLEIINTPTGVRAGEDPTCRTGRKGMNRPRGENEGSRPITRYEQRKYAEQLLASEHLDEMKKMAGPGIAHNLRTDKSGARPLPPEVLETFIEKGWLVPVEVPVPDPPDPIPCTVLDPFSGAGTTGLVALKLGRDFVGIELNPDYAEMARKRIEQDAPLFNEVELSKIGKAE